MGRQQFVAAGGTVIVAAATALGEGPAIALLVVGGAMVVWGAWPEVKKRTGLWKFVEHSFVPALLALPVLSMFPWPPDSSPIWLGVLVLCSTVVVLHYLGKSGKPAWVIATPEEEPTVGTLHLEALKHQLPATVVLTADDKDAIAKVRAEWFKGDGADMARNLLAMLGAISDEHPKLSLRLLVKLQFDDLDMAATTLATNLDIKQTVPREIVIQTFHRFQKADVDACEVLYLMHQDKDIALFKEPLLAPFNRFRGCSTRFRAEVKRMTEYPGLETLLAVSPGRTSPAARFIGEAPWEGEEPPPLLDGAARWA